MKYSLALALLIMLLISFKAAKSYSEEPAAKTVITFAGESEASVILIDGLSKTESYGAKSKNTYTFENSDNISIFGKYLQTSTQAAGAASKTETAKNWEAGARFEKSFITDILNGFVQHKAESDPYNGVFTQRNSSDLGAKYFITKTNDLTLLTELGLRYSTQIPDFIESSGESSKSTQAARVYAEGAYKFNEATSAKLWIEYVPNFKSDDFSYSTSEASLSVAMNKVLSLKTAYQLYHREMGDKKNTTTWTTALVARY